MDVAREQTFLRRGIQGTPVCFDALTCPAGCALMAYTVIRMCTTNLGLAQPVRRLTIPLGPDGGSRWIAMMVFWWSAACCCCCYVRETLC